MTSSPVVHPPQNDLIAFGLGKLQPDESQRVEEHLAGCPDCCATILNLQDDTFVNLVRESGKLTPIGAQADATVDVGSSTITRTATPAKLPAELRDHARYEIQGLIGRGGMGDVYKAQHKVMHRPVALKVIKPELVQNEAAVQRFRREVQAAARLHDRNIVTAYDAEQAGNLHFLVMEFVDGVNLDEVVRRRGALPVDQACDYIRQAAAGLQHAHELGMVHRDIKPHNLMLANTGEVKILDFGLANFATEVDSNSQEQASSAIPVLPAAAHLTQMGSMMGTPDYVAPEQATDAHAADIRADIYSLGCTFYTLLAGRPPFKPGSLVDKLKAHAEEAPPRISEFRPDVPADIEAILLKMLAKNPADRYQTPRAVVAALEQTAPAVLPKPLPAAVRQKPSRAWLVALATVASLLAILAATVFYIQTDFGVVRVEVADESLHVRIDGGTITAQDRDTTVIHIRPGERKLIVTSKNSFNDDFEFVTDSFQLRRGDDIRLKVQLLPGEVVVLKDGERFGAEALPNGLPNASQVRGVAETLTEERRHKAHSAIVTALAFAPDGQHVLSVSDDQKARYWDVFSGKSVRVMDGGGGMRAGAISPDGKLAATAGMSTSVRVWNLATGLQETTLKAVDDQFLVLRFTPDGKKFIAKYRNGHVHVWSVDDWKTLEEFETGGVHCRGLAVSPDSTWIASQSGEDTVVRQLGTGNQFRLSAQSSGVAFSPDGKELLIGKSVWNLESKTMARDLPIAADTVRHALYLPDGQHFIQSSDSGKSLRIFTADTGRLVAEAITDTYATTVMALSPDGKHLVSGGGYQYFPFTRDGDYEIRVWRLPENLGPIERESISDWTPLFNGLDLTGWKLQPDKPGNWRVENGVLIGGKLDGGSEEENSFLVTPKSDYMNFHLMVEAKLNPGAADAGVLFDFADGSWAEANIAFDPNKRDQYVGSIIVAGTKPNGKAWQAAPTDLASPGQWFTLEVIAVGRQITTKVNGKIAATHTQRKKTTGPIRLQDHGPFTVAEFRKIEIIELDEHGKPLHQDPSVAKEFAGTPAAGKVRDHLASLVAVASDGMQDDELQSWIKAQSPSLVGQKPQVAKMALEWLARLTDAERQQLLRDGYLRWKSDQLDPSRLKTLESMILFNMLGQSGMDPKSTIARAVARQLDKLEVGFVVIPIPRSQEWFISWYVAPLETGFVSMNFPLVGLTPELVMQPGGIGDLQTLQTRAINSIQRKPIDSSLTPLSIGLNDDFGLLFEGRLVAPAELSRRLREALAENGDRMVAIDLPQRPWTVAGHVDQLEQIARIAGARHITRPAWAKSSVPAAVPAESMPASKFFQSLGDLQETVRTRVEQYGGKMDGKPTSRPNRLQYDARVGGVDAKLIDLLYADLKSKAEAANATVSQEEKRDVQLRVFRYLTPSQRGELAVTLTEIPPEDGLNWRLEIEVFEWPKGALTPSEVFVHYLKNAGGGVTIRLDGETVSRDDLLKRLSEMARRNSGLQVLFDGDVVPIGADVRELMQAITTTGIPERNVKFAPSATRRFLDEAKVRLAPRLTKPAAAGVAEMDPSSVAAQLKSVGQLVGHAEPVVDLAWHPDGKRAVSISQHDGEVRMWDVATRKPLWSAKVKTWVTASRGLAAVAVSPDGKTIAVGDPTGTIHVLDAENGQSRKSWSAYANDRDTGLEMGITGLDFSPGSDLLASVGHYPGTGRVWRWDTGEQVWRDSAGDDARDVAFSRDGHALLTAGSNFKSRSVTWDDKRVPVIRDSASRSHELKAWSVAASPRGDLFACGYARGEIYLFQRIENSPAQFVTLSKSGVFDPLGTINALAFTPDGRHLISGGDQLIIWKFSLQENRNFTLTQVLRKDANWSFTQFAVSPDGRTLLTVGDENGASGPIHLWQLPESVWPTTPQPDKINLLRELPGSKEWITDVAYPENDRAVTVAVDGVVRVWKKGGAELESHQLPFGGQADISPDGRLVVVASAANDKDLATVALWELDGWKERWKIEVPTTTNTFTPKFLVDVRFAPNDRVLVRSNVDSGLAIVDAADGKVLSRYPAKGPPIGAASLSPDGKMLFVRQMAPAPLGRIYRLEDGTELAQIDTRDVVLDAVWSRDGAQLILAESTLNEGRIAVFDASTGKLIRRWVAEPKGIESLALGQGNLLATGGLTRIAVWDWSTEKLLAAVESPKQDGDARLAIALSPDGKQLISGGARWLDGEDRLPRIWQLPELAWPNGVNLAPEEGAALTEEKVKSLVSAAAGVTRQQWATLAGDIKGPDPAAIRGTPLTLLLMTLNPPEAAKSQPDVKQDFWYLSEGLPKPSLIDKAVQPSQQEGYVSFLQPRYITNVSVQSSGDTASGTVGFVVPKLYSGSVAFQARKMQGNWEVVEFQLPHYGITLNRSVEGIWQRK